MARLLSVEDDGQSLPDGEAACEVGAGGGRGGGGSEEAAGDYSL